MRAPRLQSTAPLLTVALLAGVSGLSSGCNSCMDEKPRKAIGADKDKGKDKAPAEAKKKERPQRSSVDRESVTITNQALVAQVGTKAYLWTDGRSAAVGFPVDKVTWSPAGFEYPLTQGTNVLTVGGGLYWKPGAPSADAVPVTTLLTSLAPPPAGYELSSERSKDDRMNVAIKGPEGRLVRLGTLEGAPTAIAWPTGTLPSVGKRSAALAGTTAFAKDAGGAYTAAAPEGATPVPMEAADAAMIKAFSADITRLTNGKGGDVLGAWLIDLDRDDKKEALVLTRGDMVNSSGYIVDMDDGTNRYYGVGAGGNAEGVVPVAFDVGEGRYIANVAPAGKGGVKTTLKLVRYDGYTFVLDQHR